ncbi:hypothetical protein ACAG96_03550 [Candidatus Izemoplasma sp. B36]|uniref:hypothetical protein n=1 Tax=Candidatus Izemoplasma sp. B36 TaxID=3242468 RepID=UPI003556A09D
MDRFDRRLSDIKPKDLLFVILFGVVISTLLGIAIGFIDYFIMDKISFSLFFILFFLSSQYIGNTVRKQYDYPHIVYTVITGIFLVIQALLALSIPYMLNFVSGINNVGLLLEPGFFFNLLYLVITRVILTFTFDGLLIIVVLFVGTYLGVRKTY